MRSPDNGESSISVFLIQHFGSPHVNHCQVALFIDYGILRFQIPINDVLGMQILNCQNQAADVKCSYLLA